MLSALKFEKTATNNNLARFEPVTCSMMAGVDIAYYQYLTNVLEVTGSILTIYGIFSNFHPARNAY